MSRSLLITGATGKQGDAVFGRAREHEAPKFGAGGAAVEQAQGISLIDIAPKAGVKHPVYSSVDRHGDESINSPTNTPHFISKHNIEHHLINSTKSTDAMSWIILRPVAFTEKLDGGFASKLFATAIKTRLSPSTKPLQLIATEDIGEVAADAFLHPEEHKGKAISLAGDEVSYQQLAEIFGEKTGSDAPTT
ncbi:hypothetical protein V8C37DRAFT_408007 [Trichoderma ceciliae]